MLLLIFSSYLAAPPATAAPDSARTIVVTGQRISDYEAALRACLERGCATDEDIDATLALAESQIIAGKYRDARTTLLQSLSRNKDEAARYPIPVSDLYRANGKVAANLGLDRDYYLSTWGIYRSLKEGLPDATSRLFSARMEIAEMNYRTRGHERARLYYEAIVRDALKAGRPDIAALAELRSTLRHLPPYMRRPVVEKIANYRDPTMRAPALEANLALARMAFDEGNMAEAETILKTFADFKLKRPILIYSPPFDLHEERPGNGPHFSNQVNVSGPIGESVASVGTAGLSTGREAGAASGEGSMSGISSAVSGLAGNFDDMWVDVAFQVMPDGTVSDAKVIRSSRDIFWTAPLLKSIRGRRYTPVKANSPGASRVERYTYTSAYGGLTSTRMADRSPNGRIEYIDLTSMGLASPE